MPKSHTVTIGTGTGGGGSITHGKDLTRAATGPRAGHTLTLDPGDVNGDVFLETPGMTYSDKLVQGVIFVRANGVTVSDCIARFGITGYNAGTDFTFTAQYCRFGANDDGTAPTAWRTDDGMKFSAYTGLRNSIEGFSDGAKVNGGGVSLTECWIRVWQQPGDHNDGVQNVGASGNVTLTRCNIDSRPQNLLTDPGNSCFFMADFVSGSTGTMSLIDSWVRGGQVCVAMYATPSLSVQLVVTGNRFFQSGSGAMVNYGGRGTPATDLSQITWSGNIDDETLATLGVP